MLIPKIDYRAIILSCVFSLILSISLCLGIAMDTSNTIWVQYDIKTVIILFFIISICSYLILINLQRFSKIISNISGLSNIQKIFFEQDKKSYIYCFVFITVCHIPALLAYFPGVFSYDVYFQLQFFMSPEHIEVHPITHSIMIYFTYLLYKIIHSSTIAIFVYTTIQQCIINSIFAYCVMIISKYNSQLIPRLFALLFYALFPLNCVLPLIATKDVIFSALVLLFVLICIDLFKKEKIEVFGRLEYWYICTALLIFLFRHNGIYAYILVVPIYFLYLIKKNRQFFIKILVLLITPILILSAFNIVKRHTGILPPPKASSLSVPLQQMGRVRVVKDKELSNADKKLFRYLVSPKNELLYNPYIADNMKENDESIDKIQYSYYLEDTIRYRNKEFVNLYLKWFKLYPKEYLDAFLFTNKHLWYLLAKPSEVYIYTKRISNLYILSHAQGSAFGMPIGIMSKNKLLKIFYDNLLALYGFEKNPLTFAMFSIAFNSWILFTGIIILFYQKKYDLFIILLFNFALLLTIFLGPVVLVRYVYQNFLIMPLLVAFCFNDIKKIQNQE